MTDLAVVVTKEAVTLQKNPALPDYPPKPAAGEILIKHVAVASNPKDWKLAFCMSISIFG
jgi:NADPH:quinone reductase-like Zn-dependent oxidoreductase